MDEEKMLARGETVDGWDPQNNVDETKTIGDNKFAVRHYKGLPGYWAIAGPDAGKFVHCEAGCTEHWSVYLPHRCDDWDIVDTGGYAEPVAALEKFIAEAQQALEALRGMRP